MDPSLRARVRTSLGGALERLASRPIARLQHAGLDPFAAVGAVRLLVGRRVEVGPPGALLRFALDMARRGRSGPQALIHLHALEHPEREALVCGATRLDWRALDGRINRLAHGLARLGVQPRDRVALLLPNGVEHIELSAALGYVGATTVQVGYRLKPKEVAYLLRDSGARLLVFHAHYAATAAEALTELEREATTECPRGVIVDAEDAPAGATDDFLHYEALLAGEAQAHPPKLEGGGHSGLMVYTSGTTGKPKGASRNLRDTGYGPILNFIADLPMSYDERHLLCCPLYHSAGAFFSTITLSLGGTLIVHEHFEPDAVLDAIERERVTSLALVPTMWSRLLQLGREAILRRDLSSLRWAISVAAPLPTELARQIEEVFGPVLYNFYGATETGVVTLARPGEHTARPGTIGRLVLGSEVRLLDAEGRDVPVGEVGELYVRNAMLAGYHGNDEATRASSRDGYFSVGDLARRDADGYYYIADRKHDMVISGGVNIYPWEIEQRLHAHPAVLEAAVVGVPDPDWGEQLAAFVALRPGASVTVEELQRWVTDELADYKRPRRLLFVDALPRNPTGKILKRELRERLSQADAEHASR